MYAKVSFYHFSRVKQKIAWSTFLNSSLTPLESMWGKNKEVNSSYFSLYFMNAEHKRKNLFVNVFPLNSFCKGSKITERDFALLFCCLCSHHKIRNCLLSSRELNKKSIICLFCVRVHMDWSWSHVLVQSLLMNKNFMLEEFQWVNSKLIPYIWPSR